MAGLRSLPTRPGAAVLLPVLGLLAMAPSALAAPPNGPPLLRMLGSRAQTKLEPHSASIGAVVRVPPGIDPASLGLAPYTPGFARLRGTADQLLTFADAHPELPLEVAFPPHLLLNQVGQWTHAVSARTTYNVDGSGTLVGIADTGVDFTLDDFNDPATGLTRIAWLLDLTIQAQNPGSPTSLETTYGGAVYDADDLNNLLGNGSINAQNAPNLTDTVGHGTHVASIAAGTGGLAKKYVGIAPGAQLVIARITRDQRDDISTDDLLTGVQFLFDRADAMGLPIAVNLSIGSDFGSHDGTMAWEEALAGFVGPSHPGRALFAAAGNSGDITAEQVHASVYVPQDSSRSIPISTIGGSFAGGGQVQVWVTMRAGSALSVGLDAPDGTWIAPVGADQRGMYAAGGNEGVTAAIDNGASVSDGQIAENSNSAIVLWGGTFASGNYSVTLTGHGVADLYVEGNGDALNNEGVGVGFVNPVREGTINIPATSPGIIGVGATVNRASWTSIAGGYVSAAYSPLDARGGYAVDATTLLTPVSGDVAWFSSAGPTVTGVPKPEISAPGGVVIAAMSGSAPPTGDPNSIFANPDCPPVTDGGTVDDRCMQVDTTHAVAAGTSMSAPQAAGAAALLFEKDPTLTQDKILGLLQAGAHMFRTPTGAPRFEDQGGPGELDVQGSLDALEEVQGDPALATPNKDASWVSVSADQATADGSTPLTAIVELRTVDGTHRADFFTASRLAPVVELDGQGISSLPPIVRRAPGVWLFTVTPPAGLGGHTLTLGATFDGAAIVTPKSVPIATDVWTASYPSKATGSSCDVTGVLGNRTKGALLGCCGPLGVLAVLRGRRRRRVKAR